MEKITSVHNEKIRRWSLLHRKKYRDESGCFLVEGEHLIEEALKAGCVEVILSDETCPFAFDRVIAVTPEIMKKLSANVSDVHLIAVCRQKEETLKPARRVVLLDGVQDPGNLGTIIRSAVSFGFDGIICSFTCADLYNEKTIRSTQGAFFHIPVIREDLHTAIADLQDSGFAVLATALDASLPLKEIRTEEKMAFVFGNEGQGVSREIQELCQQRVRIEMDGFESLNVAVAAGIIMYHFQ